MIPLWKFEFIFYIFIQKSSNNIKVQILWPISVSGSKSRFLKIPIKKCNSTRKKLKWEHISEQAYWAKKESFRSGRRFEKYALKNILKILLFRTQLKMKDLLFSNIFNSHNTKNGMLLWERKKIYRVNGRSFKQSKKHMYNQ